jgi:hypothetical protein
MARLYQLSGMRYVVLALVLGSEREMYLVAGCVDEISIRVLGDGHE